MLRLLIQMAAACLLSLSSVIHAAPPQVIYNGEISGWISFNSERSQETQVGVRYIPSLSIESDITQTYSVDTELSLNAYWYSLMDLPDHAVTDSEIDPYRLWLRLSSSRFELRAGLQKISFGSATLIRPLMWFDRIDPRDPLQLTDGVYGLLARYYFLNNANLWIWGLYGNDDTKGWERISSDDDDMEFGGRIQAPMLGGELAFSYHHRKVHLKDGESLTLLLGKDEIPEDRFGLDGKWDMVVGLWFEAAFIHQDAGGLFADHQRFITLGLDYTFDAGNGLHLLGEYFAFENSDNAFGSGEGVSFSAGSVTYPLGIFDQLTAIIFYDWDQHDLYRYANWQRRYDRWDMHVMGFWNPEQLQVYASSAQDGFLGGKGLQLLVVFNH